MKDGVAIITEACRACGQCIDACPQGVIIMSEAEKLCDRIGIIHKGQLLAIGSLDELKSQTGKRYLEDIFLSLVDTDIEDFVI